MDFCHVGEGAIVMQHGEIQGVDAAKIIGVPPHTIRYWEKEFSDFLVAPRTLGKQRRYGDRREWRPADFCVGGLGLEWSAQL